MCQPANWGRNSGGDLFARAQTGDEIAWRDLFNTCYPKILRAVRKKMNSPGMRSIYDSSDFVGDVWKSLAEKSGKFDFPNMAALVTFLTQAAERKVIDEHRRLHTLKNDIGRNQPLAAFGPYDAPPEVPSSDPTPSQYAQEREAREWLLSGQTGIQRHVVELKGQGFDNEEIAKKTGWSLRQVQRFFKSLADSWKARGRGGLE